MTPLTVLDLFSGIGGFSLGLERTGGFETVAFCEIEKFPQKVLAKHWPGVPCYDDVKTLTASRIIADGFASIDIITGGFPCQDLSYAGKQAGIDETTRSGLWSEIVRLSGELQPRYIVVENVSALLAGPSGKRGGWFGGVLGDLAKIGYDAEWHCIPASYVGAWHKRDRVWVIAYPNKERCEGRAEGPIFSQRSISRELVRGFEEWPGRSAMPAPVLCGAHDGVSNRVDRIAACGNAIVPQIAELIGYAILENERRKHDTRP